MVLSEWRHIINFSKFLTSENSDAVVSTLNALAVFFQAYDNQNESDLEIDLQRQKLTYNWAVRSPETRTAWKIIKKSNDSQLFYSSKAAAGNIKPKCVVSHSLGKIKRYEYFLSLFGFGMNKTYYYTLLEQLIKPIQFIENNKYCREYIPAEHSMWKLATPYHIMKKTNTKIREINIRQARRNKIEGTLVADTKPIYIEEGNLTTPNCWLTWRPRHVSIHRSFNRLAKKDQRHHGRILLHSQLNLSVV